MRLWKRLFRYTINLYKHPPRRRSVLPPIRLWEDQEKKARLYGEKYEDQVANILSDCFRVPICRNLIITKPNGKSTEIDMAFATPQGIFAVECKHRNYPPGFRVDYDARYWAEDFYNPILQNRTHTANLGRIFRNIPIYNIVFLSFDFTLAMHGRQYRSRLTPFVDDFINNTGIVSTCSGNRGARRFLNEISSYPQVIDPYRLAEIQNALALLQGSPEQKMRHRAQFTNTFQPNRYPYPVYR